MKVNKSTTTITVRGVGIHVELEIKDALDKKIIKLAVEMAKRRENKQW